MRRIIRIGLALAGVGSWALLATATVLGGNYADATIAPSDERPTAGEEREIRITLLQHGVRPVESGTVEVTASLPWSGTTITAAATHVGGGEWVATMAFPSAGEWQLRVVHSTLVTPPASVFSVGPADDATWTTTAAGIAVALLAVIGFVAANRARTWGRRRSPRASESVPDGVHAG